MARAIFVSTLVMATATATAGAAIALRGGTLDDKSSGPGMVRGEKPRRGNPSSPTKHLAPTRFCTRGVCWTAERWALQSLRHYRSRIRAHRTLRTLQVRREQRAQAAAVPAPTTTVWDRLAECESGGDWAYNGSSGFDGGLQFHPGTWSEYRRGEPAYAYQASREQQIAVAERVLAVQGWGAWPACSSALGLR